MRRLIAHVNRKFNRLETHEQSFVHVVGWFVILNIALLTGVYLMEPSPDLAPVWLPVYSAAAHVIPPELGG
jgi:hypothetical protein